MVFTRRSFMEPPLCTNSICSWAVPVEGVLKGYDQLLNLVLDETVEYARGARCMHRMFHAVTCKLLHQRQPSGC